MRLLTSPKEQSDDDDRYQQSLHHLTLDESSQHDWHQYPDYSMFNSFGMMDRKSSAPSHWPYTPGILSSHIERAVMQDHTPLTPFPTEDTTIQYNPPPVARHFSSPAAPPHTIQPQFLSYPLSPSLLLSLSLWHSPLPPTPPPSSPPTPPSSSSPFPPPLIHPNYYKSDSQSVTIMCSIV